MIAILEEYYLNIRNYIIFLKNRNPPPQWSRGEKDLLVIQGLNESYVYWLTICTHLNQAGYKIHFIPFNTRNSVKNISQELANYIRSNLSNDFSIISHSKGGIIAKYLADNYPDIHTKTAKIITIASPWSGTIFGLLPFWYMPELLPSSPLVKELKRLPAQKITNLFPGIDNRILPNSSLVLPSATNIKINIFGHTRILEASEAVEATMQVLK